MVKGNYRMPPVRKLASVKSRRFYSDQDYDPLENFDPEIEAYRLHLLNKLDGKFLHLRGVDQKKMRERNERAMRQRNEQKEKEECQ